MVRKGFVLTPLSAAVIAALGPTLPALAQDDVARLEEIIVTATKRELNLQDVPHSIDVISEIQLERMGAMDLEATMRAIPSVHLTALQPGQNQLTMRGISAEVFEYTRDAQVAVYLDEQPMTSNAQQVGIRNIDMNRIEALPGPQGTLFGSSSQSGTIRYITNAPKTDRFEAEVQGRWGTTSGAADSYDLSGILNIPLLEDKLAVRLVAYSSHDGGYVDNVFGTSFTGNYDNAALVEQDHNEYDVDGGRLHVLWNMSEKWSTSLSFVGENTSAPGAWDSDAALDDYQVTRFHEEFRDDNWTSASISVSGDLGFADLTMTATRFERDIVYEYDLMAYSQKRDYVYGYRCNAGYYYSCAYYSEFLPSFIFNDQQQERTAFEMRLVSQGDTRFQWMVGAYYEDFLNEWFYGAKIPGWQDTIMGSAANFYAYYYGVNSNYYNNYTPNVNQVYPLPPTDIGFSENFTQTVKQTALFGEIGYDLTDDLHVFAGLRWAEVDRDKLQRDLFPGALLPSGDRAAGDGSFHDVGTDSDTIYKLGLQYSFTDDVMVYGLYSQGFRVGGANSQRAFVTGQIPATYTGDFLNNYEFGVKSQLADGRVKLNVSAYLMVWDDYMQGVSFDQWWLQGTVNAGSAEATGIEGTVQWKVTDRLTFSTNFSVNDTEFQDNYCADYVNNVHLGCVEGTNGDAVYTSLDGDGEEIPADIVTGMIMPNAPESKLWASLYYEVPNVLGGDLWFYYDYSYQAESWSGISEVRNQDTDGLSPSWTFSNFSTGLNLASQLDLTVTINNVFDETGFSYTYTGEGGNADVFGSDRYQRQRAQSRPRTVWLTLRKGFGGT
ncbi:MAG: TonB-dependent receptor [Woeseiaceae bacterium]|nr:TonB-dependent receptor [Woeseiaceae bacterium]